MSAKLEIVIVDSGTPPTGQPSDAARQQAQADGIPEPGTTPSTPPVPAPTPPPVPLPEPTPPQVPELEREPGKPPPVPPTVEPAPTPPPVPPEVELAESEPPGRPGRDRGEPPDGASREDGTDRLLYQLGFGRLGNLWAMHDRQQKNLDDPDASESRRTIGQLALEQARMGVAADAMNAAGSAGSTAAGVAGSLMRNAPADAASRAMEGLQNFASKIPVVGEAVAAGLGLVQAAALGLVDVFKGITARGKELAQYSPEVAQTVAMQEVAEILNDIQEAQEMGGQYARAIEFETEMNNLWREGLLPIKEAIVNGIMAFINDNRQFLEQLPNDIRGLMEVLKPLASAARPLARAEVLMGGLPQLWQWGARLLGASEQTAENTRPRAPEGAMQTFYDILGEGARADIRRAADADQFGGPGLPGAPAPPPIINP